MSAVKISLYVHMSSVDRPDDILETLKVTLLGKSTEEETKEAPDTVQKICDKLKEHLEKVRNDGNKTYEVQKLSKIFGGDALATDAIAADLFEDKDDVFATIKINVDTKKTVNPI